MNKLKYILFSIIVSFIYINNVNATATCVYEVLYNYTGSPETRAKVSCNASDNGVTCTSNNLSVDKSGVALTSNYFKKNNVYTCPSRIYVYINDDTNNIEKISNVMGSEAGWDKLNIVKNESRDDSGSGEGTTTPVTPSEPTNPSTPSTSDPDDKFAAENFCKGTVQGVFTTLGWVFFVVKIVIPILLIVFGSIDLGKAVISSKDDEIKKSVKTLVVRTIAGIIIFFVPTILGLFVKLIDNSDVYNGTFWDCTKCMLDPLNNTCSTLRGEQ